MKEDVIPDVLPPVPKKRSKLRRSLDLYLALWLESPDITDQERARVLAEKERRKREVPPHIIVILATHEGMTPAQRVTMARLVEEKGKLVPVDIRRWLPKDGDYKEKIKGASMVLAFPKEQSKVPRPSPNTVFAATRYAKSRGIYTRTIYPDGVERDA